MFAEDFPKELYVCNGDFGIMFAHEYIDTYSDENVKYVRKDLFPHWHKYPDEKPNEGQRIIMQIVMPRDTIITTGVFHDYLCFSDKGNFTFKKDYITAWQELPKPYKED